MVDEFMVVCVDRIVASVACSDQEQSSSSTNKNEGDRKEEGVDVSENGNVNYKEKGSLRECRICQEENEEKDMEAPCACNGTLKFAHRKCIQRWCNKKGDTTCEICNQVFSPNYTCPASRTNADVMSIDIRWKGCICSTFTVLKAYWHWQAWGPHIDLRDPRLLAFAAAEHQFLQSEYDDYAVANRGSLTCFRSVAIALMLLFLVRQTLMITRDFGMLQESSDFFHYPISVLQLAGFLLPCYVVARSWYIIQCWRRRQG